MELNVTLVSLLVVIFLFIPGSFFKRFYYTGQFTKQFAAGSFAERFITSVFWGIAVQTITLAITAKIFHLSYNKARVPITKFYAELSASRLPDCSTDNFYYGAGYICFTLLLGMLLGFTCHKVVRLLKLDIRFTILRFANIWNYYFRGDIMQITSKTNKRGKVMSTEVDLITDDGEGGTRLYSGFVSHYTISPNTGELETIVLTSAQRWSTSLQPAGFKSVSGDLLIIPYSKVINLNMRYNFQLRVPGKYRALIQVVYGLFTVLSFVSIIVTVPYLYYNTLGLLKTVIVIVTSLIGWFAIVSLLSIYILPQPASSNRLSRNDKAAIWFSFVVVSIVAWFLTYLTISSHHPSIRIEKAKPADTSQIFSAQQR